MSIPYIYRERDKERVITAKKTVYLKNVFDSRLYQFIVFTVFKFQHNVRHRKEAIQAVQLYGSIHGTVAA